MAMLVVTKYGYICFIIGVFYVCCNKCSYVLWLNVVVFVVVKCNYNPIREILLHIQEWQIISNQGTHCSTGNHTATSLHMYDLLVQICEQVCCSLQHLTTNFGNILVCNSSTVHFNQHTYRKIPILCFLGCCSTLQCKHFI